MKKYFILTILLLVVLLAFTFNPSKDQYVAFAKEEISDNKGKLLGMVSGPVIDSFTVKKNYGVFSLYETEFEKEDKVVAVGFLNNFYWVNNFESSP